jgi:hypothetical protein
MADNRNITLQNVSDPEMSICLSDNGNDSTPPNFVTQRTHRQDNQLNLNEQLDDFKKEIRELLMHYIGMQKGDICDLKSTLDEIKNSNQNIADTMAALTVQNEQLRQDVTVLETELKQDRQYILFLEKKVEDLQMGIRKSNLELKNVPKKETETKLDLINMVICLSQTIGCPLTQGDIGDIYRVRGKNTAQKNTPIIIETNSTLLKSNILKMAKSYNVKNKTKICAKHLGLKIQEDTPVFLSEHLTAKGSRLHFQARDLASSKGYKFCWTAYGKVYVRKNEQTPIILISSEEQAHHLLLQD